MQTKVKLKCKPNVLEIYNYIMYHSFSGMVGAVRLGISLLFIAAAWYTAGEVESILTCLLILTGLLNPVVTPVFLYFRAGRMEKQQGEIEYEIQEDKVVVSQNGTCRRLAYEALPLIVWGKKALMLYVDGSHALLIPRRQMDGREDEILEVLHKLPDQSKVRLGRDI